MSDDPLPSFQISASEMERLVEVLSTSRAWRLVDNRLALLDSAFERSPRRRNILPRLNIDRGDLDTMASNVLYFLRDFGWDAPGQYALSRLLEALGATMGGSEDREFLRELLERNAATSVAQPDLDTTSWRANEDGEVVLEKIIGENTLQHLYVLELLLERARAVARITGPKGGTGFLIADNLLITNYHVIADPEAAAKSTFEFDYQLDRDGIAIAPKLAHARPGGLFHASPSIKRNASSDALDYAVIELDAVPEGVAPLPVVDGAIEVQRRLAIIQHPNGLPKQISFQSNFIQYVDDYIVQYTTSTDAGSSGSPAFNDDLIVVALHHSGGLLFEPSSRRRYYRNEGVRISAILADLERAAPPIHARIMASQPEV